MTGSAIYRVRQFVRALTAPLAEETTPPELNILSAPQRALFERMHPADRRHALGLYRALVGAGERREDLLVAALLHDVGKAAGPAPLWVRVVVVLLERFTPGLLARLGTGEAEGWRRPFVTYRRHPEIGAEWAAAAGCSPTTVTLIRHHHDDSAEELDSETSDLLQILRQADGSG